MKPWSTLSPCDSYSCLKDPKLEGHLHIESKKAHQEHVPAAARDKGEHIDIWLILNPSFTISDLYDSGHALEVAIGLHLCETG
mgnify:CR=1 FL=1